MADLMKMVPDILKSIIGKLGSIIGKLTDQIVNPINTMVQQTLGGAWKGTGADRFADEMKTQIVPMLMSLFSLGLSFGQSIQDAASSFVDAVNQANQPIQALIDEFNQIYPG